MNKRFWLQVLITWPIIFAGIVVIYKITGVI